MLNLFISSILFRACLSKDQDAVHIHLHEDIHDGKELNESKPILENKNTNNVGDYSEKQIIGPTGFIKLYNNFSYIIFKT